MTEPRSISLFYSEGASDKVYQAQLEERPDGWAVAFQYGRRGKPLTAGEKGSGLSFEKALSVYEKLIHSKVSKGYTEQENGVAFSSAALAGRVTGYRPQLFNEIAHDDAASLGAGWLAQEKHDGERRGLLFEDGKATFSNRRGLETGVQAPIDAAFLRLGACVGGPLELDAEDMGDHVVIFDVMRHPTMRAGTFLERAAILANLLETIDGLGLGQILRVDVPMPSDQFFASRVDLLRERGAEGYVLRRADAFYKPGRPNSGGEALKVKFWSETTCRVAKGRDGKRSIGLELQNGIDGPWVPVGNVTVPANQEVPKPGDLVEVRYLYAYDGGSLLQPTLKTVRCDLEVEAAQIGQLKFSR